MKQHNDHIVPTNPQATELATSSVSALEEAAWGLRSLLRDQLDTLPPRYGKAGLSSSQNHCNSPDALLLALRDIRLPHFQEQGRTSNMHQIMTQIINALQAPSRSLVYILQGEHGQSRVSFGAVPLVAGSGHTIPEVLEGVVQGCLPGLKFERYRGGSFLDDAQPIQKITKSLATLDSWGVLTGVPVVSDTTPSLFSPDQIMHGMRGKNFAYIVVAHPVSTRDAGQALDETIAELAYIHPRIRAQLNLGESTSESTSLDPEQQSLQAKFLTGSAVAAGIGTLGAIALGSPMAAAFLSQAMVSSMSKRDHVIERERQRRMRHISQNTSRSTTHDVLNQAALFYEQALTHSANRLILGRNQGLWQVSIFLAAETPGSFNKLAGLTRMTFSQRPATADISWNEPIRVTRLQEVQEIGAALSIITTEVEEFEHPLPKLYPYALATPLLTQELSAFMSLPREEHPGYRIREETAFSIHVESTSDISRSVSIGTVCSRRVSLDGVHVNIPIDDFTGHVLIAGVTGSGKTTTTKSLLIQIAEQGIPFLVIEPAKTEYRSLVNNPDLKRLHKDLRVFTLGNEMLAPFRVNPFQIIPGVNVQTHIDLLKDLISTAFTMWGPLPQLIEWALIHVYKEKGWDLIRGVNPYDPKGEIPDLTPTLDDFFISLEKAADHFGYAGEVGANIRAALLARVDSLRRGVRGMMLNTQVSVPMDELLLRPTLLELKEIGDDGDKAFIIGLILIRLYEWLEVRYQKGLPHGLQHVVVIEEAHRLFQNVSPSGSSETNADPRIKAVETFSNLMSEIRAYGEGLIIIDQIPTRLAPDAIKNTNTRIIHRMVARDDRDFIGLSINLPERDLSFITSLPRGEILFHRDGMDIPAHVRVKALPSSQAPTVDPIQTIAQSNSTERQYLRRHIGCTHCRKPCEYLSHAEIVKQKHDENIRQLGLTLTIAILFGEPNRSLAALNYVRQRYRAWSQPVGSATSTEDDLDALWCTLWTKLFTNSLLSRNNLAHAHAEHAVKDAFATCLNALVQTQRSRSLLGDLEPYRQDRENLLSCLQVLYKNQPSEVSPSIIFFFGQSKLPEGNLPDVSTLDSLNSLVYATRNYAVSLWQCNGGTEVQQRRLLTETENTQVISNLTQYLMWLWYVNPSDLDDLEKQEVSTRIAKDIKSLVVEV